MIKIDYRDARPIYEQVVDGIEGLALRGALPADTQLPVYGSLRWNCRSTRTQYSALTESWNAAV